MILMDIDGVTYVGLRPKLTMSAEQKPRGMHGIGSYRKPSKDMVVPDCQLPELPESLFLWF